MMKQSDSLSRRRLLASGALLAGAAFAPLLFARLARAANTPASPKTLVVLFMRGGADGLSIVVPYADDAYYRERSSIAIQPPGKGKDSALKLDVRFGLHPKLAPLRPLFRSGELAIVHAVGSPHPTRSHFDAQDFMQTGAPGDASTRDGWANRYLQLSGATHRSSTRAVAISDVVPRALQGAAPTLALRNIKSFGIGGGKRMHDKLTEGFRALYSEGDDASSAAGREALETVELVRAKTDTSYTPENGAKYPKSGRALMEVAELLKADIGVELAWIDVGGWDTHARQGGAAGQLGQRLGELAEALAAFRRDLGRRMRDVLVLTLSEFGRTVAENGTGGTDHGHGTAMFVLGGRIRGGRVYGKWPGLARDQRFEERDLAVTTDFRDVIGEVVARHLGVPDLSRVFPGYGNEPNDYLGLLR
jgi:uncharacterized protein (DUF1501 family)